MIKVVCKGLCDTMVAIRDNTLGRVPLFDELSHYLPSDNVGGVKYYFFIWILSLSDSFLLKSIVPRHTISEQPKKSFDIGIKLRIGQPGYFLCKLFDHGADLISQGGLSEFAFLWVFRNLENDIDAQSCKWWEWPWIHELLDKSLLSIYSLCLAWLLAVGFWTVVVHYII